MTFLETLGVALIPALLGAALTYFRLKQEMNMYKTEVMAERAATRLLKHRSFTDRSFKAIAKALGGWDNDPDELRKILVRAGAIRTFKDKEEWWYLLSRTDERIKKLNESK